MNKDSLSDKLKKALLIRALGCDVSETVEEYAADGDDMQIVKKKVTVKNVPPDTAAAKILLDAADDPADLKHLSADQLEKEKQKLIEMFKEKYKIENCKKRR